MITVGMHAFIRRNRLFLTLRNKSKLESGLIFYIHRTRCLISDGYAASMIVYTYMSKEKTRSKDF